MRSLGAVDWDILVRNPIRHHMNAIITLSGCGCIHFLLYIQVVAGSGLAIRSKVFRYVASSLSSGRSVYNPPVPDPQSLLRTYDVSRSSKFHLNPGFPAFIDFRRPRR